MASVGVPRLVTQREEIVGGLGNPHGLVSFCVQAASVTEPLSLRWLTTPLKAGIETVVFGPGGTAQMHQPDEYIEESAMEQGLQFLGRLLDHVTQT